MERWKRHGQPLLFLLALFAISANAEAEGGDVLQGHLVSKAAWSAGPLAKEARRLSTAWSQRGRSYQLKPRLGQRGLRVPVVFPFVLHRGDKAACLTVAALTAPSASFLLVFGGESDGQTATWPIQSAAGLAVVTRCGAEMQSLLGMYAKLRSPAAAIEFVVLRSAKAPISATVLLPNRHPGPSAVAPSVGPRPSLAPVESRLSKRIAGYRLDGAAKLQRLALAVQPDGRGRTILELGVGCHRLNLLAPANQQAPPDIDATLFRLKTGELAGIDKAQSGEASVAICLGHSEKVRLDASGAHPGTELALLVASWPLPRGIPVEWGPIARANLSRAMWTRTMPKLGSRPIFSALGVRGLTAAVVETDPNACYLAVIAPLRGEIQHLSILSRTDTQLRRSQNITTHMGSSLTFCAEGTHRTHLELRASGAAVAWMLGLWRMGDGRATP